MGSEATSNISCDDADNSSKGKLSADIVAPYSEQTETASLLDLYSGCGAMSTGLCLGFAFSGINLEIVRFVLGVTPNCLLSSFVY